MGDEQTNEFYLPSSNTVVLKWKQGRLHVPLVFENNITVDALVDSGANVSAIAENDLDTKKQKVSEKVLKVDDPPNFRIQVANGQLEKRLARATLKPENGNNIFSEDFVVVKNITGPKKGCILWGTTV